MHVGGRLQYKRHPFATAPHSNAAKRGGQGAAVRKPQAAAARLTAGKKGGTHVCAPQTPAIKNL